MVKRHKALIKALEFDLSGSIAHHGGVLTGFSVKLEEWECLITLRAVVENVPSIAFVGSDDIINCILKAVREARRGKLQWREDRYATK